MKLIQVVIATILCHSIGNAGELLPVSVGDRELFCYQAEPLSNPKGGEGFKGSDFIHPLRTPSGFVVTGLQPDDHLHHFGLWWPWKFVEAGGRRVLCWELQKGDGIVQGKKSRPVGNGLITRSAYIDRKAPDGPATLIHETAKMTASDITGQPARGYFLDLDIIHEVAGDKPITVSVYRYSGFSMRGTPLWNQRNSTILTSEGMERETANFTHARWVRVEGETDTGNTAGVLLMSHPDNQAHPEKLRTWDTQENGAIFVNFNTVADNPWVFEPGKRYARRYQLFVYDGSISATQAEGLWKAYASTISETTGANQP